MAELEIPNLPALLWEPLLAVPERSRVGFSGQSEDDAAKREFMALAGLEIASADHVDAALGVDTRSNP